MTLSITHLDYGANSTFSFFKHVWYQTQVGPATHAVIAGSMVSRGGMGGGNIIGTVRHTVSPRFWVEVSWKIDHKKPEIAYDTD
jgi:DnaJ family protein C protein 11